MHDSISANNALANLLDAKRARREGRPSLNMIELAEDPLAAVSYAVAVIRGDDLSQTREALAQLETRIARLQDTSSPEAQAALTAHLLPLELAFCRLLAEAMEARNVEEKMKLSKLAIQMQNSYARTFALVATLQAQSKGSAKVVVHDD